MDMLFDFCCSGKHLVQQVSLMRSAAAPVVLTCTCQQALGSACATPWKTPGWCVADKTLPHVLLLLLPSWCQVACALAQCAHVHH